MTGRTLYIVTCGAPLASRVRDGVSAARERGWEPFVIPTEASRRWIDVDALADHVPVAFEHRDTDDNERLPAPDAVAVVPTTFNTSPRGPTERQTPTHW